MLYLHRDQAADFFISYSKADRHWAEWIAWQLEAEGHPAVLQYWDFRPGAKLVLEMQKAIKEAKRTIITLSPDYLKILDANPKLALALSRKLQEEQGSILPVQVRECKLTGPLASIAYIDLVGLDELTAREILLKGVTPAVFSQVFQPKCNFRRRRDQAFPPLSRPSGTYPTIVTHSSQVVKTSWHVYTQYSPQIDRLH